MFTSIKKSTNTYGSKVRKWTTKIAGKEKKTKAGIGEIYEKHKGSRILKHIKRPVHWRTI